MRIKEYDYETCLKLDNPMRDFNEVKKFVESYECESSEHVFTTGSKFKSFYYSITRHIVAKLNVCEDDLSRNEIIFLHGGAGFFWLGENRVTQHPVRTEEFNELKNIFLKYKVNEHLNKNLPINETKTKRVKI